MPDELLELSYAIAGAIADELERPDQTYINVCVYGYGPQFKMSRRARFVIERYVRRAIEADRKDRPWRGAT